MNAITKFKGCLILLLLMCSMCTHSRSSATDSSTSSLAKNDSNHFESSASPRCLHPWTIYNQHDSICACGSNLQNRILKCIQMGKGQNRLIDVEIEPCYCMSYIDELDVTLVGSCLYSCGHFSAYGLDPNTTIFSLDNDTCSQYNRTGLMCGSCRDGHAPPAYSYSLACVECSDYKYNWLKYIAAAYGPLTVFYFIVIFFRINVTKPPVDIIVFICQVLSLPPLLQLFDRHIVRIHAIKISDKTLTAMFKYPLITFYGFWNLDILRGLYKPFCLHPKMTTLQALALDYVIAIYPLCLIIITYILFNHHILVGWLWTPFRRCFYHFRKEWDLSNSLIGAFCTFLLLSYTKILYISFSLLIPNTLYDVHGGTWNETYLYYDSTIEWFGREHIPYGVLAILMFLVFNLLPFILVCFYPCSCSHKVMNYFDIRRQALQTFMDAFHGHYRYEPRDYRWFAGVYFALEMTLVIAYSSEQNYLLFTVFSSVPLMMCAVLLVILKPYKKQLYNNLNMCAVIGLAFSSVLYVVSQISPFGHTRLTIRMITWLTSIMIILPPVSSVLFLVYRIIPQRVLLKLKACFERIHQRYTKKETEQIPHRLEHPEFEEYQPLVP